jgi:hypothetical protein
MAATTEVSRLAASGSDKTYSYAAIATWDGTTIADADLLQVYDNGTLLTLTTHYTVDDVNENIVLVDAYTISTNDRITIKRVTNITDPYVDFVNNSSIESSDLDLAIGQNRFKIQEIETATNNSLQYDIVNDCWDGLGYKACNFASATTSNDLVTYGQVQNLIAGVDTADVDNFVRWSFVGDGTETDFVLDDAPSGLSDASQLLVIVDGVAQAPTTNYTLSSTLPRTVTTTAAVPNGKVLQVLTVQGIVSSVFAAGTVGTDAIVDDAVTLAKINIGAGVADRFLVFDINGDPTGRVIDHTDIPDFDTGVQTNRLDQLATPTASVAMGSQKITGLLAGAADTDAVNKGQMDTAIAVVSDAVAAVDTVNVAAATTLTAGSGEIANPSSTYATVFYINIVGSSNGGTASISVKTSGGSYVEVLKPTFSDSPIESNSVTVIVPKNGSVRITNVSGAVVTYSTQTFA